MGRRRAPKNSPSDSRRHQSHQEWRTRACCGLALLICASIVLQASAETTAGTSVQSVVNGGEISTATTTSVTASHSPAQSLTPADTSATTSPETESTAALLTSQEPPTTPLNGSSVGPDQTTIRTTQGTSVTQSPATEEQNITTSGSMAGVTVTTAPSMLPNTTETPGTSTANVNATQTWYNTTNIDKTRTTSGSSPVSATEKTSLTKTPSPVYSSPGYGTGVTLGTDNAPAEIPGGVQTVTYVTANGTSPVGGGPGIANPDHEKDELKKLLLIIGGSVGTVVCVTLVVGFVVYRVAKKRERKANSRYYNFKKKKTSRMKYDKVLHYRDHQTEPDADSSTAGTGAAWVFSENDQDTNKVITLELKRKDREKSGHRSSAGKPKSRNTNKNNRNKTTNRGNYQVLAEMFPASNIPPDVLLSTDGAVHHSHSEDDEECAVNILDTSFGPFVNNDQSDGSSVADRAPSSDSWPSWNTSPFVKITQDEAVVEL